MRLVDCEPRWVGIPQPGTGVKIYIGVSWRCTICRPGPCSECGKERSHRLAVRFWPPVIPLDCAARDIALEVMKTYPHEGFHQRVSGETFDTLTLSPSIGLDPHWHGAIEDGIVTP